MRNFPLFAATSAWCTLVLAGACGESSPDAAAIGNAGWSNSSAGNSSAGSSGSIAPAGYAPLTTLAAPGPLCEGASKRGVEEAGIGGATGAAAGGGGKSAAGAGNAFGGSAGAPDPFGGGGAFGGGGGGTSFGGFSGAGGEAGQGDAGQAGAAGEQGCAGAGGVAGDAGAPASTCAAGAGGVGGAAGQAGSPPAPPPPDGTPQACASLDLTAPYTLYMSPDDSNSMASPAIVRSLLRAHEKVPRKMVRTHEFLNYYRVDLPRPPDGSLGLAAQLGGCDLSDDLAFQVSVRAPAPTGERAPMHVVLVLDTSGSMTGTPIERERSAVRAIAKSLRAGDEVSAVTWASGQTALLDGHAVTGPDDPSIVSLAANLEAGGGTNLSAGLAAGYALADKHRAAGVSTRLVLISDGIANAGITDEKLIGKYADDQEAEGTYLVGIGVGAGINDTLMDTVTDAGRGAYVFLDSEEEAQRMLVDRFTETMLVAARDVQIAVTLPPYFGIARFSGEVFSTDPAKVRPQHLAPDDAMVLYQLLTPCDASLVNANDRVKVNVTWRDAATGASRALSRDASLAELAAKPGDLRKAAAVVAYAGVARLIESGAASERKAMKLKARDAVAAASVGVTDAELDEIAQLVELIPD